MTRLEYSNRFAEDLAKVTSPRVEAQIYRALDNVEAFPEIGSGILPESIRSEFGDCVRKVVVGPFDLVYSLYPEQGLVRIEALVPQRAAW